MKALLLAAVSGTALFAAGCGSGLCHVEVDAISRNPVASPQTYYLVPAMRDVSEQSLQFQELSLIHISEPTRLLSISYAVFCLKKKKH